MSKDYEFLSETTSDPNSDHAISQSTDSLLALKNVINSRNELDLGLLIKSNDFLNRMSLTHLDFTGVASVTDFTFYTLSKILSRDTEYNNKLSKRGFIIKDCPHLSIWTLHYLNKLSNKSIHDLVYSTSLVESVAGCDSINKDLILSLGCKTVDIDQYHDDQLRKEAKIIIINENTKSSQLELFDKRSTPFKYARVESTSENKAFNFYECWESLANSFLTDRCLVVITYDPNDAEEAIRNGVMRRLFQVFCKNVIPAGFIVLANEHVEVDSLQRVKNLVDRGLTQTRQKLLDYVKEADLSSMSFQMQKELSSHVNMIEQIDLFKPLISYSAIKYSDKLDPFLSALEKSYDNLLDYVSENAFFGFELNMFGSQIGYDSYLNMNMQEELSGETLLSQSVNKKLDEIDFVKQKIVKRSDILLEEIENDANLNNSVKDKYLLAELFVKAKLYQGVFHIDRGSLSDTEEFVITDINWFSQVISLISNSSEASKANEYESELGRAFDPTNPIWKRSDLESKLKTLSNSELIDNLIQYLVSSNILYEAASDLFVSTLLLSRSEDRKKKEWPRKWENCYEAKYKWEISGLSDYLTMGKLLKQFYSSESTVIVWSDGIINRESGVDVFIRLSESKIRLTARAFDLKNMFDLTEGGQQLSLQRVQSSIINTVLFKYYAHLLYFLTINCAVFKHNKKHSLDNSTLFSKEIYSQKAEYFEEKFLLFHNINFESSTCQDCLESSDRIHSLSRAANWLFPVNNQNLVRYDGNKDLMNGLIYPSDKSSELYETKLAMNTTSFSFCELRVLHEQISQYDVTIEMRPTSSTDEDISINISQTRITPESSILDSKFSENYDYFKIKVGTVYRVELRRLDSQHNELIFTVNNLDAARFKLLDCNVYLAFRFDKLNPNAPILCPNVCMCSVPMRQKLIYNPEYETLKESIVRKQFKLSSLLDMRLEAKDRKNTFICAAATITDVKEDEKQILIHFDGWTTSYDYWTTPSDPDIYPCGFLNYMIENDKLPYRKIDQFDPPMDMDRDTFSWEAYLRSVSANAVPFEFFDSKNLAGMPVSHYESNFYSEFRCSNRINPKKRLRDITNKFDEALDSSSSNSLVSSLLSTKLSAPDKQSSQSIPRGLAILALNQTDIETFNEHERHSNAFYFASDSFRLYLTCFSSTPALLSDTVEDECALVGLHLLDTKPINVNLNILGKPEILAALLTSYGLSNCLNELILPSQEKIFSDKQVVTDDQLLALNKTLKSYFSQFFTCLGYMFSDQDFENPTGYDTDRLVARLPEGEERNTAQKEFGNYKDDPDEPVSCMCLTSLSYDHEQYASMPTHKYAKSCVKFTYKIEESDQEEDDEEEEQEDSDILFDLNREVVENYAFLRSISLIGTKVTLDKSIEELAHLKYLELIRNELTEIPKSVYLCKKLECLVIEDNPITYFSTEHDTFSEMTGLKKLFISNVKFDSTRTQMVVLPESLEELVCTSIAAEFIPFDFKLCSSTLETLTFTGFKWIDLEEFGGANACLSLENLKTKLVKENKLMSASEVEKLLQQFDNDGSGYLESEELIHLNALLFKSFDRLGFNKNNNPATPSGLPNDLFTLSSLTELDLSYQAIRFIPNQIEELKSLRYLTLKNCLLLQSLSSKCGLLDLYNIELDNCISLKTPPAEVVNRGFDSLMTYLKRLNTGSVLCKKTKLMLVGLGEAGKTSLLNSLSHTGDHECPQLTDGINIRDWNIDLPDQTQLTYSMWDFAGQSVYYNTHQFFLTSRAVYLLVWNVRLGSEYAGLEFWLSSIACHAPGAPIFLVGTHVDQVAKYELDQEDLKSRFKQIAGFHFVSSVTKQGIEELKEKIIQTTLQEKYIGEKIPAVWLNFESIIKQKAAESPIISFETLQEEGEEAGIIDEQELLQTIRFLSDLGSVQYFEVADLREYVIIDPQWIVDAFASLVSVKETFVQDGKLTLSDIAKVWSKYDSSLHDWMLKLTEKFDLTFSLPDKKLSIIPCLLPEKEAKFEWPTAEENSVVKLKDFKVLYKFVYMPAGLFNRVQVRLYQYADDSAIWKHGSYLRKNNHIALLLNMAKNSAFEVRIQGVKPENVAFLIHEVIETLISEKFNVKYDFSFPCPECVEAQTTDPGMLSASLMRRAHELKAPYVQCHKLFHAVSLQELLAIMPIEGLSNIDMNLEYSLCDLKRLKTNLKYDVAFWFCSNDVPHESDEPPTDCINPIKVIKALEDQNYRVWYPKPDTKMDKITYAIKESQMVILGLSDSCMQDERSIQVFDLVKTVIRKNYLIVEFGKLGTHKWLEFPLFASVCTDVRVIMQDPKRYSAKMAEVIENLETQIKDVKSDDKLDERPPDVFLSYCWNNSQEAVAKGTKATPTSIGWLDPRKLVTYLEEQGLKVWLDIYNLSSTSNGGLFGEITRGLNQAKVVVACLSNEYVNSKNCALEFRFAHTSLKLPIIKAIVGQGDEWKKHELSFMAGSYPEVNFQYPNPDAHSKLLSLVQKELEKIKKATSSVAKNAEATSSNKIKAAENNLTAFQELYELTQRKFLKQIIQFCDKQNLNKPFPRLFCADLVDLIQLKNVNDSDTSKPEGTEKRQVVCIKPMCEFEEGWHLSDYYMALENNEIPNLFCSYLARIMNILKNGNLATQMLILTSSEGQKFLNSIESISLNTSNTNSDQDCIFDSYSALRKKFQAELTGRRVYALSNEAIKEEDKQHTSSVGLDLIRCEGKNGKIMWLCGKHMRAINARPLSDDLDSVNSTLMDQLNNKLLEEIEKPIN